MDITCGRLRPASVSSSTALSSIAESLPPGVMIGKQLLDVVAEQRRRQHRLARVHPVDVAAQRVDFAVVADVAIGMRELPARKRIGREALVHQAQRADHFGIEQLLVELGDLRRQQQAFVDDGARGKRRNVEEVLLFEVRRRDFALRRACAPRRACARARPDPSPAPRDENLLDVGLRSCAPRARSRLR